MLPTTIAEETPLSPLLQRSLEQDHTNEPWGDYETYHQPQDNFRILSKNVNTLQPHSLDMTAMAVELQNSNASIFLVQETNTAWNPPALLSIHTQCSRVHRHVKLATSSSQDNIDATHHPGGTLTVALGKWASRVIASGTDTLLGRWSYLELVGQKGKRLIVASAYRVCPQQFDATAMTATAQQTRLLLQQGVRNPNPRQQFISDLIQQIKQWRMQNKEVLIGLDANENVDDPNSQIARLFDETDLIDLHRHRYPTNAKPATHQRGSHPIDLMIGSPLLADALTHAWILPFGDPPMIKGDHRLLGLDFDPLILFGSATSQPSPSSLRGVNSRNDQHVQKFCKQVVSQCNAHRLAERTSALFSKRNLDDEAIQEIELIDSTLTRLLLKADKQCQPLSLAPWSPAVQTAYLAHRYWALKRTAKRTERNLTSTLQALASRLDPALTTQEPTRSLASHLRQAQKQLKAARHDAAQHRKRHLEALLNQATAANQQKKSKALQYLIRAERNRQCYARFRQHTKPKAAGGLAFVNIKNEHGEKQPLLERDNMETTLLEYSRTHFAKAEGTPFTQDPLARLLQYDGLTPFGDRLTQGRPLGTIHQFDEPTTAILQQLKRKTPEDEEPPTLDYATLLDGLKKWPERTTTSPSGRHLGIYKSLGKHVIKKKKNNDTPPDTPEETSPLKQGRDVLYLMFDLMALALTHAYPLQRWRKVWTLFIEKEIGNPDLERLRCIMLFEADWQLLLKWHSSYGFLPKTEKARTLAYEQGGGRKGRSAIDQATQQIVENELVHLEQTTTIDLYLDLRTCFDLMVEACHNLACRRHGAADDYLRLHARTHQLMRYHVRHKFGVSTEYNTFSQHPWHGAGQGAADAALRYIALSDTLIDAYHTKVAPYLMHDPTKAIAVQRSLKAFIDDVVLHAVSSPQDTFEHLQQRAQQQLQWWAQLVQVTGGELNPTKCCGLIYHWEPDKDGILQLQRPDTPPDFLSLTKSTTQTPIPINQNNEGTRYLGVYITIDRNTTPMEQHLWSKAVLYTNAFRRTLMNRREAGVIYRSCFLPAMSYPLPATWLPDTFFAKVHQLSTSTFLNKMGFHRTLPRCLVFAPRALGGVGLCNLQTEMEVQQIILLLRHMRAHTPLGNSIELLLRKYQLWAGVSQPILQDTTPYPWVPDRWLSRIRRTMNEHHMTIQHDAWVIKPLRQNDIFIMEAVSDMGLTPRQLEQINACRMHLRVTTLAELVDHTGTTLLPQSRSATKDTIPTGLHTISSSKLQWPNIHPPAKKSWKLWTTVLSNLFTGSPDGTRLQHPLGLWTTEYQAIRTWHWRVSPQGSLLHQPSTATRPRAAILTKAQRTQQTFSITIPTNQLYEGPPVTPYDTHQRIVKTPVISIQPERQLPTPPQYQRTLTTQFRESLTSWQRPLFGPIRRLQPTNRLLKNNQARHTISLISDASVQKTKQSGFAWIIAQGQCPLWRGTGLAPGPAEDIYSGRAEAFGLLAGLTFLHHYINSYEPKNFQTAPLNCYCDNAGVITNVKAQMTPSTIRPNDTTGNDRDLYLAISTMARRCTPLKASFIHVKGHQDKDPKRMLTVVEQYNIECDKHAKTYTRMATQRSTALANPAIPEAQPHLRIRGKLICRDLLQALRTEIAFPPYRHYLQKKFHWTTPDANSVHWEIFTSTLKTYRTEDQRRLVLFANTKLPLRTSKAHPNHGSTLCPSCRREPEDARHFLECNNTARNALFSSLHRQLTQMTQQLGLHPCVLTALWLGLVAIRTNTPYPDIEAEILPTLRPSITQQLRLGWDQLYYGRFSRSWAEAIDATHPQLAPTGEQVLTRLLKMIWQYILDLWALRNQHLHHNAAQLNIPNYQQAAMTLYEQRHQLPRAAQDALFRRPLDQILALPAPQLEQWVVRGHKYYNQQMKAAKKQETLSTHDIRTYFTPRTNQSDDLHPP